MRASSPHGFDPTGASNAPPKICWSASGARCQFTMPLSEDAMTGLGIGAAMAGMRFLPPYMSSALSAMAMSWFMRRMRKSMCMCGRREALRPICQRAAGAMDRAGKRQAASTESD
jgi:pyruvate/2-oxoglutarate/acetoin dehydrogenase E1 component